MAGILGMFLITGAVSWAQEEDIVRPDAARRVVKIWSFDDTGSGIEPVPNGWFRAQDSTSAGRSRPGYPAYNSAVLDIAQAHSGEFSMKLPTQGGGTSLMLAAGSLPAIPDADYLVSAQVRTEGLHYARGRL